MRTHEIWVVKSEWSSWVSHSYTGTLFPKVKAVLHCGLPRAATPSSSSLWLTTERKLAHLPEASSCTPLRGNQPRSCTVSQEISLAGAYHNPLPVLFPVASNLDLLCFQISSKSKRMTRRKEKAVTKTSRVFFFFLDLWCECLTRALTCVLIFFIRSITQAHDISNPNYMGVLYQKGNMVDKGWSYLPKKGGHDVGTRIPSGKVINPV